MDKLYLSGLSQLFTLVALGAAKKFGVASDFAHLDSTSFHVHGKYEKISPKWLSLLENFQLMTPIGLS
jgi:hypothetical protein